MIGAIGVSSKASNRNSIITVGGNDVRQIGASLTLSAAGQSALYSTTADVIIHSLNSTRLASSGEVSVVGGTKVNVKAGTTMHCCSCFNIYLCTTNNRYFTRACKSCTI